MIEQLLKTRIPESGLPLEGGFILFPYNPLYNTLPQPRTFDEIVRHRFQIPGTEYGFQLDPQGFAADIYRLMPTTIRTFSVSQLQKLTWLPIGHNAPRIDGPHLFTHVRGEHQLDCAVSAAILNTVFGIKGPEALVRILTEQIHDDRTPAYGDLVFVLTGGELSEDKELPRLFYELEPDGFIELRRRWDLPTTTVDTIVQAVYGKGAIGASHKLLDSRSYLLRDLSGIRENFRRANRIVPSIFGSTLTATMRESRLFDILPHICLTDSTAYTTSVAALSTMLEIRLEAWRRVYTNPAHKALELLYRTLLLPSFLRRHRLSARDLLSWTDDRLDRAIENEFQFPTPTGLDNSRAWCEIDYFRSWSELLELEERTVQTGKWLTIACAQKNDQPIQTKIDRYTVAHHGAITPFRHAAPEKSAALEQIAAESISAPYFLIRFPIGRKGLSTALQQVWRAARQQWREGEPPAYSKS